MSAHHHVIPATTDATEQSMIEVRVADWQPADYGEAESATLLTIPAGQTVGGWKGRWVDGESGPVLRFVLVSEA